MRLYTYLSGNRDGLIPYRKRGLKLPPLPDGMIYGNMGVQENHNYRSMADTEAVALISCLLEYCALTVEASCQVIGNEPVSGQGCCA